MGMINYKKERTNHFGFFNYKLKFIDEFGFPHIKFFKSAPSIFGGITQIEYLDTGQQCAYPDYHVKHASKITFGIRDDEIKTFYSRLEDRRSN